MRVRLAAHGVFGADIDLGELLARILEFQAEMAGEPLDIALGQLDQRIGAAIAGAFRTIVHEHQIREVTAKQYENAGRCKPVPRLA